MKGKLNCPDNCGLQLGPKIIAIALIIEKEIGQSLQVTSGARCPKYNATIKGAIPGDAHTSSEAIDVAVDFSSPAGRELGSRIIIAAVKAGIKRFGIAKTYIHMDSAATLPTPRMWLYF